MRRVQYASVRRPGVSGPGEDRPPGAGPRARAAWVPLRGWLDDMDAVFWEADATTFRLRYINRSVERMLGYPRQRWLQEPGFWVRILFPEDRRWATLSYCRAVRERRDLDLEYRVFAADGRVVWLNDRVRILDRGDRPASLQGVTVNITRRKRVEEALQRTSEWCRRLVDTANEGIWVVDAQGRTYYANRTLAEMLGYSVAEMLGRPVTDFMFEEDRAAAEARLERHRQGFREQYDCRLRHREGREVWALSCCNPVLDESGAFTGAVAMLADVTEHRRADEALRETEQRLRAVLMSAPFLLFAVDRSGMLTLWEGRAREVLWPNGAPHVGRAIRELYPEVPELEAEIQRALAGEEFTAVIEVRGRAFEARFAPLRQRDGEICGAIGVATDVTERRRAEAEQDRTLLREQVARAEAEAARQRLMFIASASSVLAASLDYETTLQSIARLAVGGIADHCVIDLVAEDGSIQRVAVAHANPAKEPLAQQLLRFPPDGEAEEGVPRVLRTGVPLLYPSLDPESLNRFARDPEHLRILRALGPRSVMIVPLLVRGRILGSLLLAAEGAGRSYGTADMILAEDLASRAALAIENARLYRQRSEIARTLQESLLPPELPSIPGVELAASYSPAGEGLDVGGDFYDLFETTTGWAVLIGDVTGKGTAAAAVTSLLRHTARALGVRQATPSRILALLNAALLRENLSERFCTMLFLRVEPAPGRARVTFASAGHPLPWLLHASGEAVAVGQPGMPLGVFPDVEWRNQSLSLGPEDMLILYTDGVTEARNGEGLFGDERLEALVRTCAGLDAKATTRRIEEAVVRFQHGSPRDDIAILVLRVQPA